MTTTHALTLDSLRTLHSASAPIPCTVPGCTSFPFPSQEDLAEHLAAGRHPLASGATVVPNAFGGSTTKPSFSRPAARPVNPATEKQVAFIRSLLEARTGNPVAEVIRERLNTWRTSGTINKVAASKAIEDLKAIPANSHRTEAQASLRTNRYAAKCDDCGKQVEEGAGLLAKADDGSWAVSHRVGECPASEFPFPLGRYAVEGEDGDLKFYAVTEDGLFVQASDNLFPVAGGAQAAIIAKIALDPFAASVAYGREFQRCGRCQRGLTNKASREAGIGPVCGGKEWG